MEDKYHTFVNLVKQLLKINYYAFPFVWFVGFLLITIETITYQGFVKKYLLLDMKLLLLMIIASGVFMVLTHLSNGKSINSDLGMVEIMKDIILFVLPIFIIFSSVLYSKLSGGRNFIVLGDSFMVYPGRLVLATLLLLFFLAIYILATSYKAFALSIFRVKENAVKNSFKESLYRLFILFAIIWIVFISFVRNFGLFKFNVSSMIKSPLASYDEKMENQIGSIYKYYKFVNENTPEDAVILNPKQQGQWRDISNQGYTRYFIYPRNLISEEELKVSKSEISHVFLIGGRNLQDEKEQNSWPDFSVPAKEIIYFPNDDTNDPIVVRENYEPDKRSYPDYWGIIVVDKEAEW